MLRRGAEYLEGLRDGRIVYLGAERITDVVSHPGFYGAAKTMAAIFDLKFDAAHRDDLVVEQGEGAPYSAYFLEPRTREDLEKRLRCHKRIADATYGLFGRSPDHVASLITGLAMEAKELDQPNGRAFSQNLVQYHREIKSRDTYVVYAVLPNRKTSDADRAEKRPGLRVIREDDDGVVLSGVKALATAALFADEIWIGNLQPIAGDHGTDAITCAVRCNAPGLQLWSRKAFAGTADSEFDSPLTSRFDEGDAVLVFDQVKVDWKRVFVHCDSVRSSEIYVRTPAHCLANHQSCVRSWSKVCLLTGLANRIACANESQGVPAVREVLGRLASLEASLAALVDAQVYRFDCWPNGGVSPNRRYVYGALNWCQEFFPILIEAVRDLCGSGMFRFPANTSAIDAPEVNATFQRFWGGPPGQALEQMHLFRLAWNLVGSEFAGRQQHYERFYAGPPFVVRGHSYREARWNALDAIVTGLLTKSALPPETNR